MILQRGISILPEHEQRQYQNYALVALIRFFRVDQGHKYFSWVRSFRVILYEWLFKRQAKVFITFFRLPHPGGYFKLNSVIHTTALVIRLCVFVFFGVTEKNALIVFVSHIYSMFKSITPSLFCGKHLCRTEAYTTGSHCTPSLP